MPISSKYGRVDVERGTIGDDEPVVVFRAQDSELLATLTFYRTLCKNAGSPPHHLDAIDRATATIVDWQRDNPTRVPQSAMLAEDDPRPPHPDSVDDSDRDA